MDFRFDNAFVRELPGDPIQGPGIREVTGALWSAVRPTPVAAPVLLAHSAEMAARLGVGDADVASPEFARVFGGNAWLPGMQPYAANYGGHQFGHWAGQLGDGRAITLGETINAGGERWELQLKGAGPTPYSRSADGRAVLRSSIREFLCSEAMHHLGIPTTRALSLVGTGERVERDMFYDGRPKPEPGAVVCRVAPSFIRFGSFELPASRGDVALLRRLVDFTVRRDYPELPGEGEALRGAWFGEVCARTATLVAHWMRVGFVHGVLNTDNMSILGLTIAHGRRYRFGWQPKIAYWNVTRLAHALAHVFEDHDLLHDGLRRFQDAFVDADRDTIARKLGLAACGDEDVELMQALHALLHVAEADMTLFFRGLSRVDPVAPSLAPMEEAFYDAAKRASAAPVFDAWLRRYAGRIAADGVDAGKRRARMDAANPKYVLRNYLAQQAIDQAEAGDPSGVRTVLDVMRRPYDEQPGREAYAARRPDWARDRAGCSMLSCSS